MIISSIELTRVNNNLSAELLFSIERIHTSDLKFQELDFSSSSASSSSSSDVYLDTDPNIYESIYQSPFSHYFIL